ncbi:MAG: SGNH/GDSL hydrolase family protein [Clostridiales bacterium]|nr:SGNH/GDSL hydrolase family protein [Clostridiales bacterium]
MKTILCYGDSNTYGYDPNTGLRYPREVRWPGHLQDVLSAHTGFSSSSGDPDSAGTIASSENYVVIEEGCNGRTTIADDPVEGWKNGLDYLRPCLNSHKPVDIVIMMLGTNDLKEIFHQTAGEIADHAGILVDTIQSFTKEKQGFVPKIILVSPPRIGEGMAESVFARSFAPRAIAESKLFAQNYKRVADEKGCIFFDAAAYIEPSAADSLHLMPDAHRTLAEALAKVILSEESVAGTSE